MMEFIKCKMGEAELLAQLAEEASELAQAALKLRRVIDGKNPTPVKYEDALENFLEEVADVDLILAILGLDESFLAELERMTAKLTRWVDRLRAVQPSPPGEDKTESGLLDE